MVAGLKSSVHLGSTYIYSNYKIIGYCWGGQSCNPSEPCFDGKQCNVLFGVVSWYSKNAGVKELDKELKEDTPKGQTLKIQMHAKQLHKKGSWQLDSRDEFHLVFSLKKPTNIHSASLHLLRCGNPGQHRSIDPRNSSPLPLVGSGSARPIRLRVPKPATVPKQTGWTCWKQIQAGSVTGQQTHANHVITVAYIHKSPVLLRKLAGDLV